MATPSEQIAANLAKPQSGTSLDRSASQFSLSDQIKAAQFLDAQTAAANPAKRLLLFRFTPPGSLGGRFGGGT